LPFRVVSYYADWLCSKYTTNQRENPEARPIYREKIQK